jgi:hypothetical protein
MLDTASVIPSRPFNEAQVLSRALLRAAENLGLSHLEVAQALQVEQAAATRLMLEQECLHKDTLAWVRACLLIRLELALAAVLTPEQRGLWYHRLNHYVQATPAYLVADRPSGLIRLLDYAEGARAR